MNRKFHAVNASQQQRAQPGYTVEHELFFWLQITGVLLNTGRIMKIRFLSANQQKLLEVRTILEPVGVDVIPVSRQIEEIQTENEVELVRDKLIKAFSIIGRPLFVEHTGLYLDGLNGLPAGLTRIFWNRLEAERFTTLVQGLDTACVTAKTLLGYCDGRSMTLFEGQLRGTIASKPAGNDGFQWDCVFIPDGHSQTFAEMGEYKHEISMRRLALNKLATHLKRSRGVG